MLRVAETDLVRPYADTTDAQGEHTDTGLGVGVALLYGAIIDSLPPS